jgi:hypothetical protein
MPQRPGVGLPAPLLAKSLLAPFLDRDRLGCHDNEAKKMSGKALTTQTGCLRLSLRHVVLEKGMA